MSIESDWEAKLRGMGMPAEPPTEQEKAAEAGVELVYADTTSAEAKALAIRLHEEDPRNVFGGFPTDTKNLISLVQTLKGEWVEQGVQERDVHVTIHRSCINGHDCIVVSKNGAKAYHYNTKHITRYSREQVTSELLDHRISFKEK